MSHPLLRPIFLLILLAFTANSYAEKTDVVYLKNGDRLTGEAKSLFRGKLEFSTDHMGTVFIEWEDIQEIVSDTNQSVELANGQRFYGPLTKPGNNEMLAVETEQGAVGVSTGDVVGMYPVETGFWNRLDVTASLGFSWDKGSNVGKYNLTTDAELRHPDFVSRAGFQVELTTQAEQADTSRANLYVNHMRFRQNKQFNVVFANMEQNDQLGVALRSLAGYGYGWAPIRSNRNWFSLAGGLDVNHERPVEGESENNVEAVGILKYEYFSYSSPERSYDASLTVFPSLTDFGRWRATFDTGLNMEIIADLFWKLSLYARYDSQPISADASSSDYGVISSLGYKF